MYRRTPFMAEKTNYIKRKPIHPKHQMRDIQKRYPSFKCFWDVNTIVCIGTLQPTEVSRTYTTKITYSLESPPVVEVLEPILEKRNGEDIPHTYGNGSLCLYYPKLREWTRFDLLGDTIIPWTSLWLFYYEIWLATGKWEGGGIEHTPPHQLENIGI